MHRLFPSQQDDEKIFLVVRQHWFFLLLKYIVVAILFMALLVFQTYVPEIIPALFTGKLGQITDLLSQLFLIIIVAAIFLIWVLYYLNVQIVTNMKIVDVDQHSLFKRVISELNIDKIEDVTSETNGIFANIFQYGNVFVQTAGAKERFEFDLVPYPDKIVKLILELYEKRPGVQNIN